MIKDCFDLLTNDGSVKKMEIVSTFNIDNSTYTYIIYREIDRSHYYFAKYLGKKTVNLCTDLNTEEYAIASCILRGVVG